MDGPEEVLLESVDLVLDLIETLAASRPLGVSEAARELGISKARAHRHLRALVRRGYARQDPATERYEIGARLLPLGEMARERFGVLDAMRPEMTRLREATGQAVTASVLVDGAVTVLEMLPGRMLIEFGIRPGARLALGASAQGLVALAFGPAALLDGVLAGTDDPRGLMSDVEAARQRGWATAPDRVLVGVNALAAPVFDHGGQMRAALAIVGSTQLIAAEPSADQIAEVTDAARRASLQLGWRARAA
jgi:DNA-binding IclR family transcriptional regulator